jgi:hypothetical protein
LDHTEFYTPLAVAKEEIWEQWRDMDLRRKVEDFIITVPYP